MFRGVATMSQAPCDQWRGWAESATPAQLLLDLDSLLATRTSLAGHHRTAADTAVAETVVRNGGSMKTLRTKHPHVARWLRFVLLPLLQLPKGLSVILLQDVQLCEHHVRQMWHRAQSRAQSQVTDNL